MKGCQLSFFTGQDRQQPHPGLRDRRIRGRCGDLVHDSSAAARPSGGAASASGTMAPGRYGSRP